MTDKQRQQEVCSHEWMTHKLFVGEDPDTSDIAALTFICDNCGTTAWTTLRRA